jgi:hypothetical protein
MVLSILRRRIYSSDRNVWVERIRDQGVTHEQSIQSMERKR